MTKERVYVLRVHALEVHALAVHVDEVAFLLHAAETVLRREYHLLAAVVQLAHDDGVEPRVLRRPEFQVRQTFEVYRNSLLCVLRCQRYSLQLLRNELTCGVEQLHFERLACALLQRVVYGQLHVHRTCGVAFAELRCDVVVAYSHLRSSHEVHVAVDAGEVPHVLTLKIRAVRPAVHAHRNVVLALAHERRHVEFGVGVRTLRESGVLAVHPYHDGTARSVEVEHYALLLLPALGQVERAAVRTHRVLVEVVVHRLDARRVVVERIAHIVIYRYIVASHLPVERHLDVVPRRYVSVVAVEVLLLGFSLLPVGCVAELPLAVEQQVVGTLWCEPRLGVALVLHHLRCRRVGDERSVCRELLVLKLLLVLHP